MLSASGKVRHEALKASQDHQRDGKKYIYTPSKTVLWLSKKPSSFTGVLQINQWVPSISLTWYLKDYVEQYHK